MELDGEKKNKQKIPSEHFQKSNTKIIERGSPDNGPDKDSIENKMPFILYV